MALAQYHEKYWFPSGALASNIEARVFDHDTNTFAPLFTDATGTTPLPNPLRTDAGGFLTFWAETGRYWIHIDSESFEVGVGGSSLPATEVYVQEQIALHNADTTDVHGIPDTADLLTSADLDGYATDAELAAHEADTTNVHGIADTTLLETKAGAQAKADAAQAGATAAAATDASAKADAARDEAEETSATALAAHAADTTDVHGIPNTADLLTTADLDGYATDAELAAHEADTTNVHGITNTADLITSADLDGYATDADVATVQSHLDAHAGATTDVHGISDTAELITSADLDGLATDAELAAHAADTTDVHGIANTADLLTEADIDGLATDAELAAVADNLAAHVADTTDVHGIPDTSLLATQSDLDGFATDAELSALQGNLSAHVDATTDVHGIADTSELLTTADLSGYATEAELAAHVDATTDVHGIADTALLETQTGAQAKADAAEAAAVATASADATTKADAAQASAEANAAADAAAKYLNRILGGTVTGDVTMDGADLVVKRADDAGAYRLRVTGSALDFDVAPEVIISVWENPDFTGTQTPVMRWEADGPHLIGHVRIGTTPYDAVFEFDTAAAEATFNGDLVLNGTLNGIVVADLETQAGAQAKVDTHNADTTGVHGIADTSVLETQSGAQTKANAAQAAAISAAATDATTKANAAQAAAISAAATDATTKANNAQAAAISAAATDATTKANNAQSAAIADAATKYLNRTTGGTVAGASIFSSTVTFNGATTFNVQLNLTALQQITRSASTDVAIAVQVSGEGFDRYRLVASGAMEWGPGSAARDCFCARTGVGQLTFTNTSLQTIRAAGTDPVRDIRVSGDTQPRFYQVATGEMYWGPGGSGSLDTWLYRAGVGWLVTDTDFTVNGNLAVGGIGKKLFARRTANLTRTNTATQTDDPQLQVALAANAVYEVSGLIVWGNSAAGDIIMDFSIPSGATGWWTTVAPATSVAADPTSVRVVANVVDSARTYGWFDNGFPNASIIKGIVVTTTAGTYAFQWAQNAADATGTIVYANSYLSLERVA